LKKILIVTQFFNQNELVGSIRLQGLAKFLPEFGWEPTILTVKTASPGKQICRIIETPFETTETKWKRRLGFDTKATLKEQFNLSTYKDKRNLADLALRFSDEVFAYPDHAIGWLSSAVRQGNLLLQKEHFDAILSSSSPVTAHLIAHQIKRKHGIPWVADLRDLWTQNHYIQHWWFRRIREKSLEINTLSSANVLTTVSELLAQKLGELHQGKFIIVIPNGYDPDIMNHGTPLTREFSIAYVGKIYKGRMDPEPFLRAIRELITEDLMDEKDIVVDFFGPDQGWLNKDIEGYDLQGIVRVHGIVPREEALRKERESQMLLLLLGKNPA
jgi:glycosyltransferase involved in cell wall biosynthesis